MGGGKSAPTIPLVALLLALASSAAAQEEEAPLPAGQATFQLYCSHCHVVGGVAEGPAASADDPRPANLRRLARKYGSPLPKLELLSRISPSPVARSLSSVPYCAEHVFRWMRRIRGVQEAKRATVLEILYFLDTIQEEERDRADIPRGPTAPAMTAVIPSVLAIP